MDFDSFSDVNQEKEDDSFDFDANSFAIDENFVNDSEMEAIKARVTEMESEATKIRNLNKELESDTTLNNSLDISSDKKDVDQRSIYVGNVDYSATALELQKHFNGCGSVSRVTILCNKFTKQPKGFAYVEFSDVDSVDTALSLNETLFKGRLIKVSRKRSNIPGISSTDRGRGRGRGGYFRGYAPVGRGGGFRGRAMRGRPAFSKFNSRAAPY